MPRRLTYVMLISHGIFHMICHIIRHIICHMICHMICHELRHARAVDLRHAHVAASGALPVVDDRTGGFGRRLGQTAAAFPAAASLLLPRRL